VRNIAIGVAVGKPRRTSIWEKSYIPMIGTIRRVIWGDSYYIWGLKLR